MCHAGNSVFGHIFIVARGEKLFNEHVYAVILLFVVTAVCSIITSQKN